MKHYVLFTEEELDDMIHGEEIEHRFSTGETIYFMCKEHFLDGTDDPLRNDIYAGEALIFDTLENVKNVLDRLERIIKTYGVVMVSDLCEFVGIASKCTDHKYGWISTASAKIFKTRNGWELKMPRPLPLE